MSGDRKKAYEVLEEAYFGENKHESPEIDRLPEILDGVKCFADVGASLGQYSYYANKALKGAKFYCVEADPDKASRLRELTQQWSDESTNTFEIVERAASDKEEELTFFVPTDHLSSGALFEIPGATSDWKELKVKATTLDKIFEGVEVDFLKLDVEGAEYRALVGARNLLTRCNLRLLLEIAPWGDKKENHQPSDVVNFLAKMGYGFSVYENHYLFEKKGVAPVRWLKCKALGFILDRPGLKIHVKNLFNRIRS